MNELVHMLNRVPGTAIAYVRNRKKTKEIATILVTSGYFGRFLSCRINGRERAETTTLEKWECRVIVSTNAFGMVLINPTSGWLFIDMPGSLEEYYQEAGRAGRDEQRPMPYFMCRNRQCQIEKRLSDEFPERDFILRVYEAFRKLLPDCCRFWIGYGTTSF